MVGVNFRNFYTVVIDIDTNAEMADAESIWALFSVPPYRYLLFTYGKSWKVHVLAIFSLTIMYHHIYYHKVTQHNILLNEHISNKTLFEYSFLCKH